MDGNGISQQFPQNQRDSVGIGYIIIPKDVDRALYIAKCMRTNTVGIYTEDDEVIWDSKIDKQKIQQIEFPLENTQLGTCVAFINYNKHNTPIIVAVLNKQDEFGYQNQDQFEIEKSDEDTTVKIIGDRQNGRLQILISNNKEGPSECHINVNSFNRKGLIRIHVQGELQLSNDNLNIRCQKSAKIHVGIDKNQYYVVVNENKLELYNENGDSLLIQQDKVIVSSKQIVLGDDRKAQDLLLSKQLIAQLNKNKIRLTTLLSAIKSAPVVPQDGGAAFKTALVSAISALIEEDYSQVTSSTVKNS